MNWETIPLVNVNSALLNGQIEDLISWLKELMSWLKGKYKELTPWVIGLTPYLMGNYRIQVTSTKVKYLV